MIVFDVYVKCVSILKFKRQTPVAGDLYRPTSFCFGKQQMKAGAGVVHIPDFVAHRVMIHQWRLPLLYAAFALPRGAGAPCKRPWAVRSSSRSGQCIPYPAPAMRQFARSSGVACSNRGYHAKGTVMVRPSKRSTLMASSVTRTSLTRSPDLGSEVLIPCLQ